MPDKKKIGAYYTPHTISDFMVEYCFSYLESNDISILEPSVGDGSFVDSITKYLKNKKTPKAKLTIVEIEKTELIKATSKIDNSLFLQTSPVNTDFLEFALTGRDKYSLIIGNPPYIKKNFLSHKQKALCKTIHQQSALADREINNIWTAFVVAAQSILDENGILAFVLPTEILQVKYAQEIRSLLEKKFERLEIITANTKYFKKTDQQIVILFAHKKANNKEKGVFFFEFTNLNEQEFQQISSNGLLISDYKWTHYLLSEKEIKLLNSIYKKLPTISDFIESSAGIVTGANDYFILPASKVIQYDLKSYCKQILQKSSFVNDHLVLTKSAFNRIIDNDKPSYLLSLTEDINLITHPQGKLNEYLEIGSSLQLEKRYKCSKRRNWYVVPNIKKPSHAFFFKRSHQFPKLMKNAAKVFVTDTAYTVNTKKGHNIDDFIYSFYNIITLIFAELLGRKYGGGVLELTPNEFKELPIQYLTVSNAEFTAFHKNFKKNEDKIDFIIQKSEMSLKNSLDINKSEFQDILDIYFKLKNNRIRFPSRIPGT
jgi:adenine-specific DNA-methyltransferase